ncbi:hypothetical protein WR25_18215 [Diploscapter pachys]|uniref:Uncharacterized protein n=1 Tax=Diploscapter pachys TaxID=2018661 RepID=A0A2A2M622_9BILA|nr:hypothetical protein WR25_18215 [Diploscapter pachys]
MAQVRAFLLGIAVAGSGWRLVHCGQWFVLHGLLFGRLLLIARAQQRQQYAAEQQPERDPQRNPGRYLAHQPVPEDLAADEDQHQRQRVFEVDEAVHQRR